MTSCAGVGRARGHPGDSAAGPGAGWFLLLEPEGKEAAEENHLMESEGKFQKFKGATGDRLGEKKKKRKKKYYIYLGTGKPPEPLPCQRVPDFTNLWKKTPSASKSCVWVSLEGAPTALYPPENCNSIERLSEREAWLAEAFPNLPEQPLSLRAETTEVLSGWAWQIPWIQRQM